MFCGKCGNKMQDGESCCSRCGWAIGSFASRPGKSEDTKKYEPAKSSDSGKTVLAETNKNKPHLPVADFSAETLPPPDYVFQKGVPEFSSVDKSFFPSKRQEEYYPSSSRVTYNEDELIPKAYRRVVAAKNKSGTHKGIIAIIIVAAIVLAASAGFFAFILIYHNSEGYRLQKAENEVLAGNYDSALTLIEDIDTPTAQAIREFAGMYRDRDKFARSYDPARLIDNAETGDLCSRMYFSVKHLRDEGYDKNLPSKLLEKYNTCYDRLAEMNNSLNGLKSNVFYDAQNCVYQYKLRKGGEKFTVSKLETMVNISEPAVESINRNIIESQGFQEMTAGGKSQAVATMNEFYAITAAQVAQDKFDLDNYRGSYNNDAKLTLNEADKNYRAEVGTGLAAITSDGDMQNNARLLLDNLRYAWTAYALDIEK